MDYSDLEADYRRWREVTMGPPPDSEGWTPERVAERSGLSLERVEAIERFLEEASDTPEHRRVHERAERLKQEGVRPWVTGTRAGPMPEEGNDLFPV